jgi:hypothetical protein
MTPEDSFNSDLKSTIYRLAKEAVGAAVGQAQCEQPNAIPTYQGLLAQLKAAREKALQAAQEEGLAIARKVGFPPALNLPGGVPVKIDCCAFPRLDKDLEALGWPIVDAEMWDSDTKLDVLVKGELPLKPGEAAVLEQAADRVLSWIPHCIQISTKWLNGPPQPGLLTYQWSMADANGRVDVQFSNPQNGLQYEPNPTQTNQVKFSTYKGVDPIIVGRDARLRLHVILNPEATSTLEEINVICWHKRASDFAPAVPELDL